jgi:hypothetical protein
MQLVRTCIAKGSQTTYQTGWNSWLTFCERESIDPYLRAPPADFSAARRAFTFEVAAIHAYLLWAFFDQHLTASTIDNYINGITFHLKCAGRITTFFSAFPIVKARAALNIKCRQNKAASERGSLPVSMSMIKHFADTHDLNDPQARCTYTALLMAFTALLRISEYVVVEDSDHHLRSEDVSFLVCGYRILSTDLRLADIPHVTDVIIKIRSSKTDNDGSGTTFSFPLNKGAAEETDICFMMASWAARSRSLHGQPFFSINNHRGFWKLNSTHVSQAVKFMARAFNFPTKRFTSHSLRYGGASTLAAAQLPDSWIQIYGRWKSLTFLQYIKLSDNIFHNVQRTMITSNKFSHADIAKLML